MVGKAHHLRRWLPALRARLGGKTARPRVDHIIPIREGGTRWGSNIQPLCVNCNANKGAFQIRYVMTDRGVVGLAAA